MVKEERDRKIIEIILSGCPWTTANLETITDVTLISLHDYWVNHETVLQKT